jgi:hypothetical protein
MRISAIPILSSNNDKGFIVSASSTVNNDPNLYPYKLFNNTVDNNKWTSVWESATNTGWVKVKFPNFIVIDGYSVRGIAIARVFNRNPKNWTFEGSNDGVNWDILDTRTNITNWANDIKQEFNFNNNKAYLYYRINVTNVNEGNVLGMCELEMFEHIATTKYLIQNKNNNLFKVEDISKVPILNQNNDNSIIVSSSSIWDTTYDTWKMFNGTNVNKKDFWSTAQNTPQSWVKIEFSANTVCDKYSITSSMGSVTTTPKDWTFEGSNDGVNWDILDTRTNITNWKNNEKRDYILKNQAQYKCYRINITANGGSPSGNTAIGEMQLYHMNLIKLEQVSTTEEVFKTQGMDTLPSLTEEILTQIGSCKLLKWTDSAETEHTVNMQGEYQDKLFKLIDGCKILTWTDNESAEKCGMTYSHKPVRLMDNPQNYKLKMWTDNTDVTEPRLDYECGEYRPIDKMDDRFKVLMYKE